MTDSPLPVYPRSDTQVAPLHRCLFCRSLLPQSSPISTPASRGHRLLTADMISLRCPDAHCHVVRDVTCLTIIQAGHQAPRQIYRWDPSVKDMLVSRYSALSRKCRLQDSLRDYRRHGVPLPFTQPYPEDPESSTAATIANLHIQSPAVISRPAYLATDVAPRALAGHKLQMPRAQLAGSLQTETAPIDTPYQASYTTGRVVRLLPRGMEIWCDVFISHAIAGISLPILQQ